MKEGRKEERKKEKERRKVGKETGREDRKCVFIIINKDACILGAL